MNEQWEELKETIIELRDNDGTGTQQEVCRFLANLMDVLEKQVQKPFINKSCVAHQACHEDKVKVLDKPKEEKLPLVYADSREGNSKVIRYLSQMEMDVKIHSMAVADYQVSDEVAIERKTAQDFCQFND